LNTINQTISLNDEFHLLIPSVTFKYGLQPGIYIFIFKDKNSSNSSRACVYVDKYVHGLKTQPIPMWTDCVRHRYSYSQNPHYNS